MDWMPIALFFSFLVSGIPVLFIVLKLEAKGIDYGWFQFAATVMVQCVSFAILMSVIDFLYSNIDFVISELVTGARVVVYGTLSLTFTGLIGKKLNFPKT